MVWESVLEYLNDGVDPALVTSIENAVQTLEDLGVVLCLSRYSPTQKKMEIIGLQYVAKRPMRQTKIPFHPEKLSTEIGLLSSLKQGSFPLAKITAELCKGTWSCTYG